MEGAATGSQKNATLPGTGSKAGTARFANFAKDQDLNSAAIYAQLTGGNFQVAVPEATSAPSTPAEESDEGRLRPRHRAAVAAAEGDVPGL